MRALTVFLMLLTAAVPAAAAAERREALTAGEHHVAINGVRLWYRVAGQRRGVPVVFLHGGPGQGSETFARFAGPPLERDLRMIYLDQRGSARSERPWTRAYSLDLFVDDLEKLRQHLGVSRMALIGHSFGTVLGLEYAARYPNRVSHLVLSGAVVDFPAAIDLQCARLERVDPATYRRAVERLPQGSERRCQIFAAPRAFVDSAMYPNPDIMRIVDETDASIGRTNNGEIGQALFGRGLLDYRFTQHARLTMPVLVIAGGSDFQAVVEPLRQFVARAPRARLVEYEGLGHFMFVEDPQRFARDVVGFIRSRR